MYFRKLFFGQFSRIRKTLGFLRLTRLSPDLRMLKNDVFLFSSTGLRVRYYIFPYLGKVGTGFFSQDNSVVWLYSCS
jgi:hypothetical protein